LTTLINDIKRIKALLSYGIVDTPPEAFYDDLAKLVAIICNTPIAIISFIDDKRQWYKAKVGTEDHEVPLEETICQFTLLEDDIMEITNPVEDARLINNPNVQNEHGVRFYAGISLKSIEGYNIGTVCTADVRPQQLSSAQKEAIRIIAKQVMLHLETTKHNKDMGMELETVLRQKVAFTERQLELQEAAYNNLFAAISKSNAVIEFLPDGTIFSTNDLVEHLLGYQPNELVGKNYQFLFKDELINGDGTFWQKLVKGEALAGSYQCIHKNNSQTWVLASFNPVLDMENELVRITMIAQNITSEVMARNTLEALHQQKDNFIANISHELRTPIHAIIGFTDILLENEWDPERRKQIEAIKLASDTLLYLVNGILDLSKIEAGLFQFDMDDFEFRPVIENVFSILKLKAAHKQLKFSFSIESDVPAYLTGDKHRLTQILLNLLDNALKFTIEGAVKLFIGVGAQQEDKVTLEFRIKDTGIGIPEHKVQSIFGRFTQAEEDTTRKYGGTGLGLNICKLLVEKQGGHISVTSTEGKGSEFSFSLTFVIPSEISTLLTQQKPAERLATAGRILMCEDNETIQYLTQKLVENTGWTLDIAANGLEGVELLKKGKYDLVLMDIQMPQMDGYQATQVIRGELKSEVPIIALTAHSMIKEKGRCLAMGMNDYLSKPFDKKELLDKVSFWLQHPTKHTDEPIKTSTVFSLDRLRQLSGGDRVFEEEMLRLFIEQSAKSMVLIQQYYNNKQAADLSQEAHKLRSSFSLIGANTIVLNALEHGTDESQKPVLIQQLEEQIQNLQTFINHTIDKL